MGIITDYHSVFYVDATGIHGLIAATVDLPITNPADGVSWDTGFSIPTLATSTTDGLANTNKIVNNHGNGTYAAKLCYDYAVGSYSDWFLPAKDQLQTMNDSSFIPLDSNDPYWSSTESTTDHTKAWWLSTFNDSMIEHGNKSGFASNKIARPIRAF